jgi:precorrin-6x reductase
LPDVTLTIAILGGDRLAEKTGEPADYSEPAVHTIVGHTGRRTWLTAGASEITCFGAVPAVHYLLRVIDPPPQPLSLQSYEIITGRGPFWLAEEHDHIKCHEIRRPRL